MPLSSVLAGFGLGLSLIVAIGAQNVFVLRQGIRREHVFAVAAICALSDLALIMVGVSGIGVVLTAVPWLVDVIRWAGAAFLVAYGLLAARRAIRPSGATLEAASAEREVDSAEADAAGLVDAGAGTPAAPADPAASVSTSLARRSTGLAAAVLTCLALTWLNPHVYLDTVFLLGSVANTHGDARWAFAAGAGIASIVWFFGLAYGARLLGGVLSSPRAWRVLDAVIAVVMVGLGVMLVLPH
ncbi:L-lysine exporter family protein LysE/ArgO [Agromyces hippuratus]|uniref:L-lysine exporter family protein LysE/ArgO n=1 Tax=Agromyces hippuratus TaxID=286438 RepID=A0A852WW81_9MICO|nr:LysE/ArgO family amino acid transporter [Agromyces hippuratus]NYG22209.1 L-lysine exporter family protein LysE/ArgO [Agromyces hippuratus]